MIRMKRLCALLLCAVLLTAAFLPFAEAAHATSHHCAGEHCAVCERLSGADALLRLLVLVAALIVAALRAAMPVPRRLRAARMPLCASLIRWKVRLND